KGATDPSGSEGALEMAVRMSSMRSSSAVTRSAWAFGVNFAVRRASADGMGKTLWPVAARATPVCVTSAPMKAPDIASATTAVLTLGRLRIDDTVDMDILQARGEQRVLGLAFSA